MFKRIARDEVRLGMFIQQLEGDWFSHPFWRTQFVLNKPSDLAKLWASDVEAVIIDESRSAPSRKRPGVEGLVRSGSYDKVHRIAQQPSAELLQLNQALRGCRRAVSRVFGDVRLGRGVDAERVASIAKALSVSLNRNPAAVIELTRLKSLDSYTYVHSIAVSGLMVHFGRYLKLDETEIQMLGMAGLLHDIGKITVPTALLLKPGRLSPSELEIVRSHARSGYDILASRSELPELVREVCLRHHERMDGQGYPDGLASADLSRPVRIATICDVYDAVTSVRPYRKAWSPIEALTHMTHWEGHFDPQLLSEFVICLGYEAELERIRTAPPAVNATPFALNGFSDPAA